MATEEKLFSLQNHLEDADFEDVFRVYLESERKDRKIALLFCLVLAIVCIVLLIVLKNVSFAFYAVGCIVVGIAYVKVPANRKFLATTRLLMGDRQNITFYPHEIYVEEHYDSDEAFGEMVSDEEEDSEQGVSLKTGNMMAYEHENGFLFADGKIANLFSYIPKRILTEEQIENVREFAKERCSRGYMQLEMNFHIVEQDESVQEEVSDEDALDERTIYYGAKRLRIRNEDGTRVMLDENVAEDEEPISDDNTESELADEDMSEDLDAQEEDSLQESSEEEV